jgi:hypothetical protein
MVFTSLTAFAVPTGPVWLQVDPSCRSTGSARDVGLGAADDEHQLAAPGLVGVAADRAVHHGQAARRGGPADLAHGAGIP